MQHRYRIPIKAKHFIDASFIPSSQCAVTKALREYFNTEDTHEHVSFCMITGVRYTHDSYGVAEFKGDQAMAQDELPETIIRELEITKQNVNTGTGIY